MDKNLESLFSEMGDKQRSLNELLMKQASDIEAKKEEIIKDRLIKKGYGYLLNDLSKRRFKRIICEKYPDKEIWYVDNDTIEGERIVTFEFPSPLYSFDEGMKVSYEVNYF
jgi:hypothetical protein